jgi:DNA-binding response OmpR family regulator
MKSSPTLPRILIVDDDPALIKALGNTLRDEGYPVVAAPDGQAAIETFQEALKNNEPFGLVITDLGMNLVDGGQVARAVKTLSPLTPVILLTGWGEWFDNKEGIPLPVDFVLAKPPRLTELRAALAKCLKSGKA